MLKTFYKHAFNDPLIGPFFTDVAELDLDVHLSVICDFWESILWGTVRYRGNVMHKHLSLNAERTLQKEHFERWLTLFEETLLAAHRGPKTDKMIARAQLIGDTMHYKLLAKRGKR